MKKIGSMITSSKTTVILFILALFSFSFFYLFGMDEFILDTAVQIKGGQWIVENKQLISDDMFSWHEGLKWMPHEQLWYIIVYLIYSLGGVIGITVFGSLINIGSVLLALNENRKYENSTIASFILLLYIQYKGELAYPCPSIRPQIISLVLIEGFILVLLHNKDLAYKLFPLFTWLTALIHGGTIKLPFMIFAVYIVISVIQEKEYKGILWMGLGFISSLLTPNLLDTWTYQSKQEMYPEIMKIVNEWKSMSPAFVQELLMIVVLFGMALDDRTKKKDKNHLFKLATLCMFILGCTFYNRMFRYASLLMFICAPKAIDNFVNFVIDVFNISKDTLSKKLNTTFKVFIVIFNIILIVLVPLRCYNALGHVNGNTLNDAAESIGYDMGVVDIIKEKGYTKIYNDYNIGSWLLFNDIKVHVDNRMDPYLVSYSGEDHIHNEMYIDSLTHLDDFYEKYHPDAIVLQVYADDINPLVLKSGEEYKHLNSWENFIEEIDTFRSDRYTKVYDNITSGSGYTSHWVIYECNYN